MAAKLEPEQVQTLRELMERLRQSLAADPAPQHLSRYYELLREVQARLKEGAGDGERA